MKIVQVLHILTRNYKLTIRTSLGKHDVCSYSDHALLISDIIFGLMTSPFGLTKSLSKQ